MSSPLRGGALRPEFTIAAVRERRLRWPCLLVAILICSAFGVAAQSVEAATNGVRQPDIVTGAAARDGSAATHAPKGPGASLTAPRRVIPLRSPRPAKLRQAKARAAALQPSSGAAVPPQSAAPSPLAAVFGGLNKPGMFADEFSGTPPDTTGAIGPNHYVEFVNSVGITAYDRNLNPLAGPVALADFIGFPEDSVFDPQIQWDENWGRWIYAMDDIEEGPEGNYLAFGWSKTADPTNLTTEFSGEELGAGWCEYFIFTGEFFDDYPKLGHSDSGITIGTNVFTSGFVGSRIWSIAKPASPQTCPELGIGSIGAFGPLETEDGDTAFTPVPANTADSSPNSYVVAADSPFFTADAQIMGWHVSGAGGGATLVEDGNMAVSPFEFPANVPQPGTTELLDSLDARLTNAVAVTDPAVGEEAVWTQHTVAGPGGRSVVRWYELLPAAQTVRQEGTISDPSHFVFNAAISPSTQGNSAAIDFNRGSSTLFPEMHAQSRDVSTPLNVMGNDVLLGTSAGAAADFSCEGVFDPCRWGDYAGASPDPAVAGVVWGSNQGLAAPSGEDARWTTRNFALVADETPPAAPVIAGTDPASPANDNNPEVKGSAEAGSTVRVYKSPGCTGAVAAQGSAATFASPGLTVAVADNQTAQLSATATDPVGNTSACSASASYTEVTPPPTEGGGAAGGGGASGGAGGGAGGGNGTALGPNVALVKGGRAFLGLSCPAANACGGTLQLVAQVKVGKGAGAKSSRRRTRNLVIGTAGFAIPAGGAKVIRVPLTAEGKALVRKAGRRGLGVKLRGSGVSQRTLRLRQVAKPRKKRR